MRKRDTHNRGHLRPKDLHAVDDANPPDAVRVVPAQQHRQGDQLVFPQAQPALDVPGVVGLDELQVFNYDMRVSQKRSWSSEQERHA